MPVGELVTVPLPEPVLLTVKVKEGECTLKGAVCAPENTIEYCWADGRAFAFTLIIHVPASGFGTIICS